MLLQIIAGALYSLSFKPIGLWLCAPLALALQFYLLRKFRFPEIQSFLFAFSSSLIILSWSKTFVGALPWIALAFLQGLLAIPLGVTARFTVGLPPLIFMTLLLEELRARFPFGGFSWTRIAFSQAESPYSFVVSFAGVIALSLLTLLITSLILEYRKSTALILLFLFVVNWIPINPPTDGSTINIRAIQGGVPLRGLEFNARAQEVLNNHIAVTLQEFSKKDDVILWPENAIDIDPTRNLEIAEKIDSLQKVTTKPLIAGAILDSDTLRNATLLFDPNGEIKSTYIKRYLTPFGEFIPYRNLASKFSRHVKNVSDFSPGIDLVVHRAHGNRIGSIICYELLNDGLVRDVSSQSDFLVVHTNSATFSGSSEGEQQLAITRLRAIESGKSIVSISTTGPSAVINARGEVLEKLEDNQIGSLAHTISLNGSQSVVHLLGGWHVLLVLLLTLLWALFSARRLTHERWSR